MLIPPSQEFDPGTLRHNNGKATMSEILNMVPTTSSSTIASAPVPHRYQYTLEVPRILRHLRPLKAKISAIELAIKSAPSYGYSSNNNNNNNNITVINSADRHERYSRRSQYTRSQDEEQESRPRRGRSEQYYGRLTTASASLHDSETTAANGSSSAKIGRDLLIKRFQHSLTDVFRELIDKYWWQPICDDYDLPLNSSLSKVVSMGINPSQYTLGMTCAFAVGRIIASLPGHQAILVEKYYNIMPESMRRFALLEHAVRMCTSSIAIKDMLKPLVEVCVRYRADAQALHILEHMLVNQDEMFQLDYRWAYIVASRVESADSWVRIWAQKAPISFFTSRQFSVFTQELPQHGATLIQASITVHMRGTGTDLPDRTRRARSVRFATSLIEESLKLHGRLSEGHGNVLQTTLLSRCEKCDGGIERLARSLFDEHELQPESWQKGVALALALHSLYAAVTTSPESTTIFDGMSSWVDLLENRATAGICASDFNVVIQAYGTLVNLNSLALMLDAVGLYSLSMELIDRMLTEFYDLENTTSRQLGYPCDVTIQSLESLQREVEQRRMQQDRKDGWRYDDVMETWVEVTPKADKTLSRPINDFTDTDGCDTEGEGQENYPASPTRSRYKNANGSNSRDAFSEHRQQRAKKLAPQTIPHSPFVMKRSIRYSMTPVRRSNRPGRRLGRCSDSGGESEFEMDADEGIYVAPMDLEVLARFTIEDSENEDVPGHELQSFSASEFEGSSSDSTTRNAWSSMSSNAFSQSDQSTEEDGGFDDADVTDGNDEVPYDSGSDDEAVSRPSRRRLRENVNAPVLSPHVIILSDSTQQSDTDLQDSDGDGTFSCVEKDTPITSDENSQVSNNDESSDSVVTARALRGRRRQVSKPETEDDSGTDDDDGSGEDVQVISDDDVESSKDSIEASLESVDEASSESDYLPAHRKRPSQRPSQHRHALNTPESEPDTDTQDDSNKPIHHSTSIRHARRRINTAKQEQYRTPTPAPSPPQESSVASPSRIQLRKKRPQSYSFPTGFSSPSDDDGMVSDFQESIKKSKSRSSGASHTSQSSTSAVRAKPVPLSSRRSKVATKFAPHPNHTSRGYRATEEIPGSSEGSDMDNFVNTRTFKSNERSTFTYGSWPASASHLSKGAMTGGRILSRRKRVIVYDDDVSDKSSDNGRSSAVPVSSSLRVTRNQDKKRTAVESDVSENLPRTRTRSRPIATRSHAGKKIRIEEDDTLDDWSKSGSEHAVSTRKVNRKSRELRGSASRRVKTPVVVVEDSLDDAEDSEQETGKDDG